MGIFRTTRRQLFGGTIAGLIAYFFNRSASACSAPVIRAGYTDGDLIKDSSRKTTTFVYDSGGRLTAIIDSCANPSSLDEDNT